MKNNFLSIIILMLFANLALAQTANKATKPVYQKVYWFATGIEQKVSDLLLDNPNVVSEIISIECELPNAYNIGTEYTEFSISFPDKSYQHCKKNVKTISFYYIFA